MRQFKGFLKIYKSSMMRSALAERIILSKREKYSRRKKDANELIENCGLEVLDFLPNVAITCPVCNGTMSGNGGSNFICRKCKRQVVTPKKKEMEVIREWAFKREKCLETIFKILRRYKGDVRDLRLDFGELDEYL